MRAWLRPAGAPLSWRISISLPEMRVAARRSRVPAGRSRGQLDEGEVRADVDVPEVPAGEPALVGERADDLARLDLVALADREAVGRHLDVGAATGASLGLLAAAALGALLAGVEVATCGLALGLHVERVVAVHDRRQGSGDVDLGHVVLGDVVGDHVAEEVELVAGQRLGDRVVEPVEPGRVDVLDRRDLHLGQRLAGGLLDGAEQVLLARRDEGDRVTTATRAAGAADPVDVGLGVGGDVVVDDVADPLDVETARGHVGGDQDVELARLAAG